MSMLQWRGMPTRTLKLRENGGHPRDRRRLSRVGVGEGRDHDVSFRELRTDSVGDVVNGSEQRPHRGALQVDDLAFVGVVAVVAVVILADRPEPDGSRAGWVSMLRSESRRNAVQPLGSRDVTLSRGGWPAAAPAGT